MRFSSREGTFARGCPIGQFTVSLTLAITYPFSLGVAGGSVIDCVETVLHLAALGTKIHLLPVSTTGETRYPRPPAEENEAARNHLERLRSHGVKVYPVAANRWHYQLDGLPIRQAVKSLLKKEHIDALLGWSQEPAMLVDYLRGQGVCFGMIAAAPYAWVVNHHQPGPGVVELFQNKTIKRGPLKFLGNLAYRCLFRNPLGRQLAHRRRRYFLDRLMQQSEVIFSRSQYTRKELVELFGLNPDKISVAYCGVHPDFAAIPRARPASITNLFYSGLLKPQKGIFDLLSALGQLHAAGQRNWKLRVAGWGDEEQMWAVVRERGIAAQVEFLGRLDRASLCRELQWAHLAVLPSHFESFGLGIAEAQAAGLPVVACHVGAVPEVVQDGVSGWLVPPYHPEALAEAITSALLDSQATFLRGLAGRERVATEFTWQRCAQTMLMRLEELCCTRSEMVP